jgi:toxin HigB-1
MSSGWCGGHSVCSRIAVRIAKLYHQSMIRSFRHKGLEAFYRTGSKAGIQPSHAKRLRTQLSALDVATCPEDMGFPAWRLHPLTGELSGFWAVTVNANWRLIFRFVDEEAEAVDYLDYH